MDEKLQEVDEKPRPIPFFNAPRPVLYLCLSMIILYIISYFLPKLYGKYVISHLAFMPGRFSSFGDIIFLFPSFPGYMFLHADLSHLLTNTGMLLAFGTPVYRIIGARHFGVLFLLSGFAGAAIFWILGIDNVTLIGASAGISGMLGACCCYVFWYRPGVMVPPPRFFSRYGPSISVALGWIMINGFFIFAPSSFLSEFSNIAWQSHYAGFFMGAMTVGFFAKRL